MFEVSVGGIAGGTGGATGRAVDASTVATWATALRQVDRDASDAERIDQIRALEDLKCAAAAAQAVLTADFDRSQRAEQATAGVPAERQGRGVAAQVALARRESPHRAQQHLGLAKILASELPHTMAAFLAGRITEWKATLVGRETRHGSRAWATASSSTRSRSSPIAWTRLRSSSAVDGQRPTVG